MWMCVWARVASYTWKLGLRGCSNVDIRECERGKCSHNIRGDGKGSGRVKCASGVGRDNGDSKGGIMLSSCQWEITKTMEWVMTLCTSRYTNMASGDQGSITLCQYRSALNFCITSITEGSEEWSNVYWFLCVRRKSDKKCNNTVRAFEICICMMHKCTESTHLFSKHFCWVPQWDGRTGLKLQKSKL